MTMLKNKGLYLESLIGLKNRGYYINNVEDESNLNTG